MLDTHSSVSPSQSIGGDLHRTKIETTVQSIVQATTDIAQPLASPDSSVLIQTKNSEQLVVALPPELKEIIGRYPEYIDMQSISEQLSDFDGSSASIEGIIASITEQNRKKLIDVKADFNLFGPEVISLVKEIEEVMTASDGSVQRFIIKKSSKIRGMMLWVQESLQRLPSVIDTIRASQEFIERAGSKIDEKKKQLDAVKASSKEELISLFHNYILYTLLLELIKIQLTKLRSNKDTLTADQELEILLLEARGVSMKRIATSLPSIASMNHQASSNIDTVKINLQAQYDELVIQLGNIVSTVRSIHTINDAQMISKLLGDLSSQSILATFNLFRQHMKGMEAYYQQQITSITRVESLKGQIATEIATSDSKVNTLRQTLLAKVGLNGNSKDTSSNIG